MRIQIPTSHTTHSRGLFATPHPQMMLRSHLRALRPHHSHPHHTHFTVLSVRLRAVSKPMRWHHHQYRGYRGHTAYRPPSASTPTQYHTLRTLPRTHSVQARRLDACYARVHSCPPHRYQRWWHRYWRYHHSHPSAHHTLSLTTQQYRHARVRTLQTHHNHIFLCSRHQRYR